LRNGTEEGVLAAPPTASSGKGRPRKIRYAARERHNRVQKKKGKVGIDWGAKTREEEKIRS